jgi:colanic acid biosynthesis glycosyl transferase WcaI
MAMRILYLSQYFPPEAGATQTRAYEMAKTWVTLGHQVTMLCEFPNHPSGIIPSNYKGKIIERDNLDGIDIIRVWVKASPLKIFRTRMLFYLSFMINATLAGLFFARHKYDFIYATSPPLFVGGAALVLKLLKNIPLVFEVRDLWPESAIELGELKSPRVISLATKLEEACYRGSTKIVVVTHGIYKRLIDRGIPHSKLIILPNGANIEMFKYSPSGRERLRTEMALEGKFIAIYAGIHGLAQGLETVLEAAKLLVNQPEIYFILIGDGPKKAELLIQAKSFDLPNLAMLPEEPRQQIPDYLSTADIAIVPLKKAEIFKGALPSKIFDAWACERPVLLSIDGEARQIVETVNGGVFIPPEDPIKMAETIIFLSKSPKECLAMGKNGLIYTQSNHSRATLAENLIQQLSKSIRD